MSEAYEIVVIDLPAAAGQVYVRTWESGQVDVDFRETLGATWQPIEMVGGSFRQELITDEGGMTQRLNKLRDTLKGQESS